MTGNPVNLSILLTGGRENNSEGLSSGEQEDRSLTSNPNDPMVVWSCGEVSKSARSSARCAGKHDRGERSSRTVGVAYSFTAPKKE